MREIRSYGSVRGAVSNDRPYRDTTPPHAAGMALPGATRPAHIGSRVKAQVVSGPPTL
jgi:hypothetical protein